MVIAVAAASGGGKDLSRPWVFPIFVGTWVVLGIFTLVVFVPPWYFLLIAAPFVVLISLQNIRGTAFCPECGKTVIGHPFQRTRGVLLELRHLPGAMTDR